MKVNFRRILLLSKKFIKHIEGSNVVIKHVALFWFSEPSKEFQLLKKDNYVIQGNKNGKFIGTTPVVKGESSLDTQYQ